MDEPGKDQALRMRSSRVIRMTLAALTSIAVWTSPAMADSLGGTVGQATQPVTSTVQQVAEPVRQATTQVSGAGTSSATSLSAPAPKATVSSPSTPAAALDAAA